LLSPGVDAAGDGAGIFQAVAVEPGTGIEDVLAGVVVEENGAIGVAAEETLLVGLIHEFGAGDGDSFVFFAGAGI